MGAGLCPVCPGEAVARTNGKDIEAFFTDLGKRPGTGDWQVKQAEHALKILYEVFLPEYAPVNSYEDIQKAQVRKKVVPRTREDVFRDQAIPGEVERLFAPLISAMKTEIGAVTTRSALNPPTLIGCDASLRFMTILI